jgi:hypothetical protein
MISSKDQATTSAVPHLLGGQEAVATAAALAAEIVVVLLALSSDVPFLFVVIGHLAVVMLVAAILLRRPQDNRDSTVAEIIFLVILVAGPAGAAAALAALAFVDHAGAGPAVLESWYARLSRASHADAPHEFTDRIKAGRVLPLTSMPPVDFEHVIAEGSLAERQAALGLMARKFHTDFAPALEAALRSEEPVVRVQAAAVVARVRADLKVRIKNLIGMHGLTVFQATELSRLADCALVDRADAERCRKRAREVLQTNLPTGRDVHDAARLADRDAALVIERFLMSAGRYRDFRVSRRLHRLVVDGNYRVRLIKRGAEV